MFNFLSPLCPFRVLPTRVQGRDFGYRGPGRWVTIPSSLACIAGALALLWWGIKQQRALPV